MSGHPSCTPTILTTSPRTQSFEQLNQRAVAVVIDPIQSVKGKVVIDAFRTINPQLMLLNQEPRQTTSNIGHLNKPSIQALIHGLNRHYYSIVIDYRKNELEEQVNACCTVPGSGCVCAQLADRHGGIRTAPQMLMNLHKKSWTYGLKLQRFEDHHKANEKTLEVHIGKRSGLVCVYIPVLRVPADQTV